MLAGLRSYFRLPAAPTDITWARNIVLAGSAGSEAVLSISGSRNFSDFVRGLIVERNTYFSPFTDLAADAALTPLGDWGAWRAAGWDSGSAIADPLFADPGRGDFRLDPQSPALAAGFVALPPGVDQC